MTSRFLDEAEGDLVEVEAWYRSRATDLDDEFRRAFEAALASIEHMPKAHARVYRQFRRALVRRSPHAVFYALDAGEIAIVAVLHTAREVRAILRKRA